MKFTEICYFFVLLNFFLNFSLVFNVGEYRRQATEAYKNHEFFNPDNKEAMAIRRYVYSTIISI